MIRLIKCDVMQFNRRLCVTLPVSWTLQVASGKSLKNSCLTRLAT